MIPLMDQKHFTSFTGEIPGKWKESQGKLRFPASTPYNPDPDIPAP